MSDPIIELAEGALGELTEKFSALNKCRAAAQRYVRVIIDAHPKIKLPQLLSLEQTKELMGSFAVSKNMLAQELTAARAKLKAKEKKPDIKIPPHRRRSKLADKHSVSAQSPQDLLSGELPNSPMPSGRVANGTIADL